MSTFWDLQASAGGAGISILWRGTWSNALSYNPNDAVSRNGSSWISLTNNTNVDPATDGGTNWNILAAGGTGPQGANAFTTTSANFDVPVEGASVSVNLVDASWVTIGQMVAVQTAGGSLADAYSFEVTAKTGNQVTLKNVGNSWLLNNGDMTKAVYDTNSDSIVDRAALADVVPWTGVSSKPSTFPPDATAELVSRKAAANGYASLDGTTKVPIAQLPISINPAFVTLTDAATVTWTVNASQVTQNAKVTLAGNRILAFSGIANGMNGTLIVIQGTGGSRTLTLPSGSKVINTGAGLIVLSTAVGAIDILTWIYDGTNYFWTLGKNYT